MQQDTYSTLEVVSPPQPKDESPKFVSPSELNDQPEAVQTKEAETPKEVAAASKEVATTKQPDHSVLEGPPSTLNNGRRRRRKKWILWGGIICVVVTAAVVGGVVGGVLSERASEHKASKQSPTATATGAATSINAAMSGTATALTSYSYPTAVSWGSPHMEVFALDTDAYPNWKYRNSTASAANQWNPENKTLEYIGGASAPFEYGIAAITRDAQNVDIFVTGSDLGLYHKSHSTDLQWIPSQGLWEPHGGICSSAPSVASWSPQRLDVFVIGEAPTFQLFQMTWDDSGWGGWVGHPAASMSTHAPAVVSWGPGRLDVFALGANDHALYYRYYDGKQWYPEDSLTNLGGFGTSRPVAISLQQGRIDVFMRGGDADIWHKAYSNSTWFDWTPISGRKDIQTEPAIVSCVDGVIDVFAWDTGNSLLHKRLNISTGAWTPDNDFDKLRDGLAGPPSAVSDGSGSLHVFAYMQAGDLGHLRWNESSKTWSPGTGVDSLGIGNWS